MTNYKQLCAELLSELENAIRVIYGEDGTRHISSADPVITKVRTALAEPEPSTERPDRLRVGDVWEFLTEEHVKGKRKPEDKLLQWEVKGWHNGEYAWELQSLDGEHRTYLMEFAPSYEEMRFVRSNEPKAQ